MEFPGNNGDMRSSMHVPVGRPLKSKRKLIRLENKSLRFLSSFLVVGAALLLAAILLFSAFGGSFSNEYKRVNGKEYQAIFLANTTTLQSVYFGKIKSINDRYVVLTDVFYINQQSSTDTTQSAQYQLIKLGKEIHAPQDLMVVNKNQVLFWENLKDDGQVVTKIKEYKANPPTDTSTTSTSSQNQSSTTPQSTTKK